MQFDEYGRQRAFETLRVTRRSHALVAMAWAALLSACSAHHHNASSASDAGDTGDADTVGAVPTANDTGNVVDYDIQSKPVVGATLSEGEFTTTTDAKGLFAMAVPLNTP